MLDSKHGGDTWREYEALMSAGDKQIDAQMNVLVSGKSEEEILREQSKIWEMEGEDIDYLRTFMRAQSSLREMMGSDRVDKFFAGPNEAIEKPYFEGMEQADDLFARGQITGDEWEARHQRLEEEYNAALNSAASPTVPEDLE